MKDRRAVEVGAASLSARLQEWLRDRQASHDPDAGIEFGLTVASYPTKSSR